VPKTGGARDGGYAYRFAGDCPRLDYATLAGWLGDEPVRRISGNVIVRRYGRQLPGGGRVISVELYGTCLALVRPDRVTFPETRDGRPAITEWAARVARDNGIGTPVFRYARRKADGPGPPGPRGPAGILLISGDRDRPVEGFTYRTHDPGGEPWCSHDGPDTVPGRMCECGQRVPRHSDYRERSAAALARYATRKRDVA